MLFWAVAIAASLGVVSVIFRAVNAPDTSSAEPDADLTIYKDQLTEVDRDLQRGVLSEAEAEAARTEVSRRILAADRARSTRGLLTDAPTRLTAQMKAIVTVFVVFGSLGLYALVGSPGVSDMPLSARLAALNDARAARPSQLEAEASMPTAPDTQVDADYLALVAALREAVSARPNDIEGHRLLALHESELGHFIAAHQAQSQVVLLLGEAALVEDLTDLAELMIVATGGYVSPQAETVLNRALKVSPTDGRSRYYFGLALAQNGHPERAIRVWQSLLQEGPDTAPWIALIRAQIAVVAAQAGFATSDVPLAGPTADDIGAAGDLSEADRNEMILGMVEGLAERLASDGGSASEWAQLIRAYSVLGRTAAAADALFSARAAFADDPAALALLTQSAKDAGISQ